MSDDHEHDPDHDRPKTRDINVVPGLGRKILALLPADGSWVSLAELIEASRELFHDRAAAHFYGRANSDRVGDYTDRPVEQRMEAGRRLGVLEALRSLARRHPVEHDGAGTTTRRYRLVPNPVVASEAPAPPVAPALPTVRVGGRTFTILFPHLLRPLGAEQMQELRESISLRGVVVPVVVDEDGGVIDGGNRVTVAGQLGLAEVPTAVRAGLTDEQKAALAYSLNHSRRHLGAAEWADMKRDRAARIARAVEARRAGQSLRAIAQAEGVSESQVRSDLKAATAQGCAVEPAGGKVQSRDGRVRPATAAPRKPTPDEVVEQPSQEFRIGRVQVEQPPPRMLTVRAHVAEATDLKTGGTPFVPPPAAPAPASPPRRYPNTDRLHHWLHAAVDQTQVINIKFGGIRGLLAEKDKVDRRDLCEFIIPVLRDHIRTASGFLEELQRAVEEPSPTPPSLATPGATRGSA